MIPKILENIALRRFHSLKNRSVLLNEEPPKREDFIKLLDDCYNSGFKCIYCKKLLLFKDVPPYRLVPSIDHKLPLRMGGHNNFDNLVVCCNACNIIKGTLSYNTYIELLECIKDKPLLLERMFSESFNGRFANKMERNDEERNNKGGDING